MKTVGKLLIIVFSIIGMIVAGKKIYAAYQKAKEMSKDDQPLGI